MNRAIVVMMLVLVTGTAWAQDQPRPVATSEPVSLTVAMVGTVVVGAGFGLMLHTSGPCHCQPDTAWVVGGVAVVAAGVTMTWLGLRSRTVIVAPTVAPRVLGATTTIRWGADRKPRPHG